MSVWRRSRSLCVKGALDPVHRKTGGPRRDGRHIEASGLADALVLDEIAGCEDDPLLLFLINAFLGAAESVGTPIADLHEDHGRSLSHDEVDFSKPGTVIAVHEFQSSVEQVAEGMILRLSTPFGPSHTFIFRDTFRSLGHIAFQHRRNPSGSQTATTELCAFQLPLDSLISLQTQTAGGASVTVVAIGF